MTIEQESSLVQAGQLIRIPSFAHHQLKNTGSEELDFLSIYSKDFSIPKLCAKAFVTAAPPTPNGPLHLGHISGPYLASDIMSRYLRRHSVDVIHHSGTDDHQNYVQHKAQALQKKAGEFRTEMRKKIQAGLKNLQIHFDEFIEPATDKHYQNKIQKFKELCIQSKVVLKEKMVLPYCSSCKHFLRDAFIIGNCPFCNETSQGGCENCGLVAGPQDLTHPRCTVCDADASEKQAEVYTFNLSQYLPLIENDLRKISLPKKLINLINKVQHENELKVLVTMPDSDHSLHVWFEMAAHYQEFSLSDRFWIHSFGFDNSFYYLLFIPALLKALNPKAKMPDVVLTNEFLLLEGKKFSTSRNHAIWANEFSGNTDHLRLHLSLNRPIHSQSDFKIEDFKDFSEKTENQLLQLKSKWIASTAISKGQVSEKTLMNCHRFTTDMNKNLSFADFDLRQASRRLMSFIDEICQSSVSDQDLKVLLQSLQPMMALFMPTEAQKLLEPL